MAPRHSTSRSRNHNRPPVGWVPRPFAESRSYLVYLTLNDFERRLDPERFIRVHRAHIVNLDFVKQLVPFDGSRMQIEMRDGTKILASRTRSKELRQLAI